MASILAEFPWNIAVSGCFGAIRAQKGTLTLGRVPQLQ
jgi:hypothetical protein